MLLGVFEFADQNEVQSGEKQATEEASEVKKGPKDGA